MAALHVWAALPPLGPRVGDVSWPLQSSMPFSRSHKYQSGWGMWDHVLSCHTHHRLPNEFAAVC